MRRRGGIDVREYEYLKPDGCIPLTPNKQEQVLSIGGNTKTNTIEKEEEEKYKYKQEQVLSTGGNDG